MMMSSVASVKFIKTKFIFSYQGVSNKVSSKSDHEINSYSCSNSISKMEKKLKSGETFSELQNWVIRGLQIGACFRDYKLGQEGLKIRAAFEISNRGKNITYWGRNFESEQGLQIDAEQTSVTNPKKSKMK